MKKKNNNLVLLKELMCNNYSIDQETILLKMMKDMKQNCIFISNGPTGIIYENFQHKRFQIDQYGSSGIRNIENTTQGTKIYLANLQTRSSEINYLLKRDVIPHNTPIIYNHDVVEEILNIALKQQKEINDLRNDILEYKLRRMSNNKSISQREKDVELNKQIEMNKIQSGKVGMSSKFKNCSSKMQKRIKRIKNIDDNKISNLMMRIMTKDLKSEPKPIFIIYLKPSTQN